MTKRLWTLSTLFAAILLLGSSGILRADRETHYTVRYSCIISPDVRGEVEGEWDLDCYGNLTGWGWEPGHNCTTTDISYGAWCGPDVQPPPYLSSSAAPSGPACLPEVSRSLRTISGFGR